MQEIINQLRGSEAPTGGGVYFPAGGPDSKRYASAMRGAREGRKASQVQRYPRYNQTLASHSSPVVPPWTHTWCASFGHQCAGRSHQVPSYSEHICEFMLAIT